ncbi:PAS domain-containing protein [Candidatus Woesearchaeota archaeon]|nr:PAS domain-containing protein [Candidatus Woesearchaeota archaeon]
MDKKDTPYQGLEGKIIPFGKQPADGMRYQPFELYELMANASSSAMTLIEPVKGDFIYRAANERFLEQLGAESHEVIGSPLSDVWQSSYCNVRNHLITARTGEKVQYDARFAFPNGAERHYEIILHPIKDDRGRVIYLMGEISDITRQKILEESVQRVQRHELEAEVAHMMAHDFRGQLTAIIGNLEVARNYGDPLKIRRCIENAFEVSLQAADQVNQYMTDATDKGKEEEADLNSLVRNSFRIMQGFRKDITIHADLCPDIWGIMANPVNINRMFMNLYKNASEAMTRSGELFVTTWNTVLESRHITGFKARPGEYAAVSIRDTGPGMGPEVSKRAFDLNFTTKREKGGSGLGLYSVFTIVTQHHGMITLSTAEGKGAEFTICLPARAQAAPDKPAQGLVMIVDKNQETLKGAARLLEDLGYRAITAENNFEALHGTLTNKDDMDAILIEADFAGSFTGSLVDSLKLATTPETRILLAGNTDSPRRGRLNIIKPYTSISLRKLFQKAQEGASQG